MPSDERKISESFEWLIVELFEKILERQGQLMADFSKLNDAVTKLSTDVDALIAAEAAKTQPAIDAATTAVEAVDAKVLAATPA